MQSFNQLIYSSWFYDRIKDLVDKAMKVGVETDLGLDYVLDYEERTKDETFNCSN
jgi:hypothetical protein